MFVDQSVIPLSTQLDLFKEYINKLKGIVGEDNTNFIIEKSLYVVVGGSDDIANTYFDAQARLQYDIYAYTDLMSNSASNFLQVLNVDETIMFINLCKNQSTMAYLTIWYIGNI